MNNTITERKNTLEGINSRKVKAEEKSELEMRLVEITSVEQNKEYTPLYIFIHNYTEFKWIKCSNQKTQTG